ncbi:MAG: hypothetical protein J7513_04350 [Solirubrobacteraceae bacterium]|nr:hypothetical protein [Solirubrobacteraceae bacterium]
MAALRWFLFSVLCFGGGAVGAFAVHPPNLGIPAADAEKLRERLALIQQYASEGRCTAVQGQLQGAESTIRKLPESTAVTVQQELQNAVQKVRTEAVSECLRVAASKQELEGEAQATTPSPTATAEPQVTEAPTPTPEAGGPDPGTGEGQQTPESTTPDGGGGIAIPEGDAGAAVRQGLHEARKQFEKARKDAEKALHHMNRGGNG